MNLDSIPELQEHVTVHNNDYCMWFISDGEARRIVGRIPFELEWGDMTEFINLFRHNETGEVVADHYCFRPIDNTGVWELDSIWGTGPCRIDMPQIKYTRTDADGVEYVITEQEYQSWMDSLLKEHTRLAGESLPLSDFFKLSEDTAETFSAKLVKAPKVISDYFDIYDGIDSMIHEEYVLPEVTK